MQLYVIFGLLLRVGVGIGSVRGTKKCGPLLDKNGLKMAVVVIISTQKPDESLTRELHLKGNKGYIEITMEDSQCKTSDIQYVYIEEARERDIAIYDPKLQQLLNSSSAVIGEYMESIHLYIPDKPYLVTSPITNQQHLNIILQNLNGTTKYMLMWPLYSQFAMAMGLTARALIETSRSSRHLSPGCGKMFLMMYTETANDLESLDIVRNQSRADTKVFDLSGTLGLLKYHEHETATRGLRIEIELFQPDAIVLYLHMDAASKMRTLKTLLGAEADLGDRTVPWLLVDMVFPYQRDMIDTFHNTIGTVHKKLFVSTVFMDEKQLVGETMQGTQIGVRLRGLKTAISEWAYIIRKQFTGPKSDSDDVFSVHHDRYAKIDDARMVRKRLVIHSMAYLPKYTFDQFETFYKASNVVGSPLDILYYTKLLDDEKKQYAWVVLDPPFVMIRNETGENKMITTTRYEGLAIDIYERVKARLAEEGYYVNIELEEASSYGARSGMRGSLPEYTGVFRELTKCDISIFRTCPSVLGIGQFSVTNERRFDPRFSFTPEFGFISDTIMVRKDQYWNSFLRFARPFHYWVWVGIGLVTLFSGLLFYCLDKWNPFRSERRAMHGRESFWHSYLLITQIGAPFGAHTYPTRVYSVFYWFFALVVVGCYTGNLASFLTEADSETPEIRVEDLPQSSFKYGLVNDTSVMSKFAASTGAYRAIYETAERLPSNAEGVKRVRSGGYVLFGTSIVMTSYRNKDENCSLSVRTLPFYEREMDGIAFPIRNDWKLKEPFNRAMRMLIEAGELQVIYEKWIAPGSSCTVDEREEHDVHLGVENFAGLYILLGVGTVLSFLCLGCKLVHIKLRGNLKDDKTADDKEISRALRELAPEDIIEDRV